MEPAIPLSAMAALLRRSQSPGPTPNIFSAASSQLRSVIAFPVDSAGDLAIAAVKRQLEAYNESQSQSLSGHTTYVESDPTTSLFDAVVDKLYDSVGDDPEDIKTILALPINVLQRAMWKWDKLPYTVLCSIRARISEDSAEESSREAKRPRMEIKNPVSTDLDEWILRNEKALRVNRSAEMTRGLIRLSKDAQVVFPGSTCNDITRTITRGEMSGYKILDARRAPSIMIQPSVERFASVFNILSDGLLKGLDWTNVFIAGGIVLGTLLCTDPEKDASKYLASDIDVYIYGLGPVEANAKIEAIYDVWKKNLPVGAPSLVVRNSRTITFFSDYPTKRIQIVLKLVKNPKEVLLNFDLDVCSIGWDGSEVWLLPRAARALETGYSVYTTNLVHGHYLGERRASQEQRVFKYADKGYGIRILPSYVEALERFDDLEDLGRGERLQKPDIHVVARRAQAYIDFLLEVQYPILHGGPPSLSHSDISSRDFITPEITGRSCLAGFERFMRHVVLWQRGVEGRIILDNTEFASVDYDQTQSPIGYDDTPVYPWGIKFRIPEFLASLAQLNDQEREQLRGNLDFSTWVVHPSNAEATFSSRVAAVKTPESIQRIIAADTLAGVLGPAGDAIIPLFLPTQVLTFANTMISQALQDHSLPNTVEPLMRVLLSNGRSSPPDTPIADMEDTGPYPWGDEEVVYWRIDAINAWQQIDRRLDEVNEILWCFRHANAIMHAEAQERLDFLIKHLSKRAIRRHPDDEMEDFARWIGRIPQPIGSRSLNYTSKWDIQIADEEDIDEEDIIW